jgi:hypothetical protein
MEGGKYGIINFCVPAMRGYVFFDVVMPKALDFLSLSDRSLSIVAAERSIFPCGSLRCLFQITLLEEK